MRNIQNTENAQIVPDEIRKDLECWRIFLPRFNGVSMMDLEEWSQPDQFAASDACLTSCGGFSEGKFFHAKFPDFILNQNLHINALELLTVMVTVKMWCQNRKGKKIVKNCDNSSPVRVLNVGFSRDTFMQSCFREIYFFASIFEIQNRAKEISGCENRTPDYLSRWDTDPKFETLFYC